VLTRPLGASFADWMGKPREKDGLGFGDGTVGIALLVLIVIVVGYLTVSKRDVAITDLSAAKRPVSGTRERLA
jgi:uncharacterized membrane-anchored protein